jgi:uncharacterized protein HemX
MELALKLFLTIFITLGIVYLFLLVLEKDKSSRKKILNVDKKSTAFFLFMLGLSIIVIDLAVDHSSRTATYRQTAIGNLRDADEYHSGSDEKLGLLIFGLAALGTGIFFFMKSAKENKMTTANLPNNNETT